MSWIWPGLSSAAIAHAVLVLQRAFQHVAEDLHVAMRMRAEALPGRDAVVIDDAQGAEAHVRRIVVVGEGEGVMRLQPAVIGVAAFVCPSDVQFGRCRFHGEQDAALRVPANANVLGLSLPFGYAGRHGTPTTAILRGGGRDGQHQPRGAEDLPDAARAEPANQGAGRRDRTVPAGAPGALNPAHARRRGPAARSPRAACNMPIKCWSECVPRVEVCGCGSATHPRWPAASCPPPWRTSPRRTPMRGWSCSISRPARCWPDSKATSWMSSLTVGEERQDAGLEMDAARPRYLEAGSESQASIRPPGAHHARSNGARTSAGLLPARLPGVLGYHHRLAERTPAAAQESPANTTAWRASWRPWNPAWAWPSSRLAPRNSSTTAHSSKLYRPARSHCASPLAIARTGEITNHLPCLSKTCASRLKPTRKLLTAESFKCVFHHNALIQHIQQAWLFANEFVVNDGALVIHARAAGVLGPAELHLGDPLWYQSPQ